MSNNTTATGRRMDAPPERVYAAFADPAQLARLVGPRRVRNSFAEFDFREGGAWRFTMHGPDGRDYPNESRFLALQPGRLIALRHLCAPLFELRIGLTPAAAGQQTDLRWTMVFDDAALAEQLRPIIEPANEQNLDRLAACLAATEEARNDT